jgi:hypothetical protein
MYTPQQIDALTYTTPFRLSIRSEFPFMPPEKILLLKALITAF